MTVYFLKANTAETANNFQLLANQNITLTEEGEQILKNLNAQEFPAKIQTLEMSVCAIGATALLVTKLFNFRIGILVGALSVIPGIGIYYLFQRQKVFVSALAVQSQNITFIYDQMVAYLNKYIDTKEDELIYAFNRLQCTTLGDANETLRRYTATYDKATEPVKMRDGTQIFTGAKDYASLKPLVELILQKEQPLRIDNKVWLKLQRCCQMFLYGRGALSPHISFPSKEMLDPHATYVRIRESDSYNRYFTAVKY